MRLIVRKALDSVNHDDQQSFKKYLRQLHKSESNRTFYGKFKC